MASGKGRTKAAENGAQADSVVVDRVADLLTARDRLLAALEVADGRSLPALVRELRGTLADLDAIAPKGEGTALDDLAARRAARLAGSNAPVRAGSGRKRGS